MHRFLEGQTALVTGASNGLGTATARLLGRAGAKVAITARRRDKLDTLAEIMRADGTDVLCVEGDLSSDADVENIVKTTLRQFGQIDILCNIGGTADGIGKNLLDVSPAQWAAIQGANTNGPFYLIRHILPHMLERNTGRMMFVSSPATQRPIAKTAAYTASRMAVNGLVHALPLEIGDAPIAFNAFNPGAVDTQTYANVTSALNQPANARSSAQTPDQAAILPLWLCAPETYGVTGEFLHWRDDDVQQAVAAFAQKMGLAQRR